MTSQPVYFDGDAVTSHLCTGFYLFTTPYGGVRASDWMGKHVSVVGKIFDKGGRPRDFEMPGKIEQMSCMFKQNKPITFLT